MPESHNHILNSSLDEKVLLIHRFQSPISDIDLPARFTFPFYYDPHPLSLLAAKELQSHIQTQKVWDHNFGLDSSRSGTGTGKMFGVLVIEEQNGDLGYLCAFSGKLADANDHVGFVPPIYDMLDPDGFFNQGMLVINPINAEYESLKRDPRFLDAKKKYEQLKSEVESILKEENKLLKLAKKNRKARREKEEHNLSSGDLELLKKELTAQSLENRREYKAIDKYWQISLYYAKLEVDQYQDRIDELKQQRKALSNDMQKQLFEQYNFLNQAGERRNVIDIFKETPRLIPPSAAGDCAAPKLFQYAFQHDLKPIAMAEFWWGKSPNSEIRKHGLFYPSCRGKCEPILGHMLQGIEMDPNPMLVNLALEKVVDIVYEDEIIVVVNKPPEMLSVPGRSINDSVASRMQKRYPDATGPLTVHRLDMSTSGLLIIAKTQKAHKYLQRQFINRTIKKRYVALLKGDIKEESGEIKLPLRVDIDDRPRQMVCYEHGKAAHTKWEVIDRSEKGTRVYFYPVSGRTHQLRVHASHPDGLNTAIVGDDLYGQKADRLYLHAEWIQFTHPVTREVIEVSIAPEF